MERRMSAVLVADMVAFSRLMELDEIGTLERQKRHLADVFQPELSDHNGRIVKTTGDGILAEFPSVIEAVACSVDIQREINSREAASGEDQRISYRFGINLGDVIHDEGDIFGDGVNIAARLEQLADPGGICISGSAFDHLRSTIEVGYEDLGDVQVKNISRPVRAWRVLLDPDHAGDVIGKPTAPPQHDLQPTLGALQKQHGSLSAALEAMTDANRDQMEAIASRFDIANAFGMPDGQLRVEIFRKADDFRRYRAQVEAIDPQTAELSAIKAEAIEAAERLDFEEVEDLLAKVMETEIGAAAQTVELRAQNALLRGNVDQAFVLLTAAADSFAAVDPTEPLRRRLEYEIALSRHGQQYGSQGLLYAERMTRWVLDHVGDADPMLRWRATIGLGIALSGQGNQAHPPDDIRLLKEAVATNREALTILSEDTNPVQLATTRNNLGTVLQSLARRVAPKEAVKFSASAAKHFREALTGYSRSAQPMMWAMAQDNLGNALDIQGRHQGGAEGMRLLHEALLAHDAALEMRDAKEHPLDWARTLENIAVNWTDILANENCEDRAAAFEQAKAHLDQAIRVFEKNPISTSHAKAHSNYGRLLEIAAKSPDCEDPRQMRNQAVKHLETALSIYQEFDVAQAAEVRERVDQLREFSTQIE